ncbi:hypothetical protein [Propionivibrio dicarboxylicus]|uniref:Uncharacterized protein n=1 Tax=Propionivibrio dicarboxylicus TaxID=83767 RepID=A0A1G7Z0I0_9RHOO|nr:hypothetical protein [Propionivibrio dicarboxylicus]SDH02069.1 hypothetical protein SAMN05660652_01033 [Propionivibrio dicarboxylicus]
MTNSLVNPAPVCCSGVKNERQADNGHAAAEAVTENTCPVPGGAANVEQITSETICSVTVPEDGLAIYVSGADKDQASTKPAVLPYPGQVASVHPETTVPTVGKILFEIQKFASWDGDHSVDIQRCTDELLRWHPGNEGQIVERIKKGKEIKVRLAAIYNAAYNSGGQSDAAKKALDSFCKLVPYLKDKGVRALHSGDAAYRRREETQRRKESGKLTNVVPPQLVQRSVLLPSIAPQSRAFAPVPRNGMHPQDIRRQKPAPACSLVIDETGSLFSDEALELSATNHKVGRWVALLVPDQGHGLPKLRPGWHAEEESLEEQDRVVQAVLNANVGVFGLTVQQIPVSTDERWAAGVLSMIDWVLRLLPLDGPTSLKVKIENRDVFAPRMEWKAIESDAIRRLALAYPERARLISLDILVIDKAGSPFNGFVDALAFTWGSPNEASRARLEATQLRGRCFLEGNTEQLLRAWEWLDRGIMIRSQDWSRLLDQPDVGTPGSLTTTILQRLGDSYRSDEVLWQQLVAEVCNHLDSKAIDIGVLSKQVNWLEEFRPVDGKIPPRLRLLWLTARLANANHLGGLEQEWMKEMEDLCQRLMDEDAPLVCWAQLHLAVTATNRFDFASASQLLQHWRSISCQVPGLRYWAQVHSSLGQHAAFLNSPKSAQEAFELAINAFGRLSDDDQRRKDVLQTATYRALVDVEYGEADEARKAVEFVIGPIVEAIDRLAVSDAPANKYHHHLLMRWLIGRGNANERAAYVSKRLSWQCGDGHPWPLIELYRGMLLVDSDKPEACRHAIKAYELASGNFQGPVVRLIGACCRAVAMAWGEAWPEGPAVISTLEGQLPAANEYIVHLRRFLAEPSGHPMEMLQKVLPFNFH